MQERAPLFSIVMPTRNRAHLLRYALRSALEQDFDDYEIVVVANNCHDDTRAVVEELRHDRVRYYETDTTLTMPDNWELAWTKACGTYVTYLPDDDALVPSALRLLAEHALDGMPPIVSWEDAPYYYPNWHDPAMQNLLLLFYHGEQLVEDVPSDVYRRQLAQFNYSWSAPLPKLNNCIVSRAFFDEWRCRLGRLFFPVAPDYSFAWVSTHICPSVRTVHRPLTVRGVSDYSIGSNAALGAAGSEFFREFGDLEFFAELPVDVPTSLNHLAATFSRANQALRENAIPIEPFDQGQYLVAVSKQLRERESEELLADRFKYFPGLLAAAAAVSGKVRDTVEEILSAPVAVEADTEHIRQVRDRTVRMAMGHATTLLRMADDHLGDEQCARCVLGIEKGLLAGPTWDSLYVFGEEVGAADPYAMSQRVDQYYDLVLGCRRKNKRVLRGDRSTLDTAARPYYEQGTEVDLLTKLLGRLENKTVVDVGAERGSFTRAFLAAGAERVYAFEPYPANVTALKSAFGHVPTVQIFDVALGNCDGSAQLHVVEDKTEHLDDAYHSLVAFEETPSLRVVGEIPVQCRTLDSLVAEGAIPPEVGILKVDTERSDFAVLQGMGQLSSVVVMIEFWEDLPETVGPAVYQVADVAAFMAERGYSSFVVIKRHDQFETLQINNPETRPGDWGNVVFIHDSASPRLGSVLFNAAALAQAQLIDKAELFADEARKRLAVIGDLEQLIETAQDESEEQRAHLEVIQRTAEERQRLLEEAQQEASEIRQTAEERLVLLKEIERAADERLRLMQEAQRTANRLQRALDREVGQSVSTRLLALSEQELAIDAYLQAAREDGLWRWVPQQLGVLHQHDPVPFHIPEHYLEVIPLSDPPSISLVTPCLNSASFLPFTMNSILDQEYPALEYVIQDGGSTDDTLSILEERRDRLAHVASERDSGMAQAINRGFAHTSGEIMAYLNADDLLLPGALHYIGAYFARHPEVDVIYGHRVLIDADNAEVGRWVLPPHDDAVLTWADYVPQETLFWRRSIWEKAGGAMDESFRFALDWDLILRFRSAGATFARLPRFLGAFRVHAEQKTSRELRGLGFDEMDRLREREAGRPVTRVEVRQYLAEYMRRHKLYHKLYRLGVLRY